MRIVNLIKIITLAAAVTGIAGCVGVTGSAYKVTMTGATLVGYGTCNNGPCRAKFQYGTTTSYGSEAGLSGWWGAGASGPLTTDVANLSPNTVYHFRLCGQDMSDQSRWVCGADAQFKTSGFANPVVLDFSTAPLDGGDPSWINDGNLYWMVRNVNGSGVGIRSSGNGQTWNWTETMIMANNNKPSTMHASGWQGGCGNNSQCATTQDVSYWGPEIAKIGNKYVLAVSGNYRRPDGLYTSAIFVGTATSPTGPYTWINTPVMVGRDGAYPGWSHTLIDPYPFRDPATGRVWMIASGQVLNAARVGDHTNTHIVALELNPNTLMPLNSNYYELLSTLNNPQPREHAFFSSNMRIIEGAGVMMLNGQYFLHYASGSALAGNSDVDYGYQFNVANGTTAFPGTFSKNEFPVLSGGNGYNLPGHGTVIKDHAGEFWLMYHAFRIGDNSTRWVMIQQLYFNWISGRFWARDDVILAGPAVGGPPL
jgi:hypothetical protein